MASEQRNPSAKLVVGLLAVLAGTLFLLHNQGIIHIQALWRFWPVIFFAIGIGKAFERNHPDKVVSVGVMFLLGTAFLLVNFHYLTWAQLWPLGLIGVGLLFLWQGLRTKGERLLPGRSNWSAIFSSVEKDVSDREFIEGEANTVFGAMEVDLTHADMQSDKAYMNINVVFGSVEMRVPESWKVEFQAVAVFGSCENKTRPLLPANGSKTLVIRGDVVFGSVEIRN
jgi:predicted membrane protein